MLIVIPPPWRLTPLLFRLFFFAFFSSRSFFDFGGGSAIGRDGESVPSNSDRSESSSPDDESAKGKRPSASSMSEMPSDQTSDLTVYCAPCIRSGCGEHACQIGGWGEEPSLTLIYVDVPTKVSAIELMSSPETPKSQILIWPLELQRMLDGLMSTRGGSVARERDGQMAAHRGG
jgi:hypothetical protein